MTPQQKDILTSKMFDSPQSLTPQEIEAILNDPELLDLYQTAVLYKDSKPVDITYDMDKEWASMNERLGLNQASEAKLNQASEAKLNQASEAKLNPVSESNLDQHETHFEPSHASHSLLSLAFWKERSWRKYAAGIAVFVSITAIAAITTHYVFTQNDKFVHEQQTEVTTPSSTSEALNAEDNEEDNTSIAILKEEKVFEAITLEEIAQDLSQVFDTTIEVDDNVKGVRLYLRLPQGSSVEDLLTVLDQYESLSVQRDINGNIFIGHGE